MTRTRTNARPEAAIMPNCRVWSFQIDGWRPALVNELVGRHRMVAHHRKRSDADLVAAMCRMGGGIPRATGPRRIRLTLWQSSGRRPDPDAVWKSLLDALVKAEMLVDDSATYCVSEPVVFKRGPMATRIELEDI